MNEETTFAAVAAACMVRAETAYGRHEILHRLGVSLEQLQEACGTFHHMPAVSMSDVGNDDAVHCYFCRVPMPRVPQAVPAHPETLCPSCGEVPEAVEGRWCQGCAADFEARR